MQSTPPNPASGFDSALTQQPHKVALYTSKNPTDPKVSLTIQLAKENELYDAILSVPNWQFTGAYYDLCDTSTPPGNRPRLTELRKACESGTYDLVVIKALSSFGSNTKEILRFASELNHLTPPVTVLFHDLNLYSGDNDFAAMCSTFQVFEEVVKQA